VNAIFAEGLPRSKGFAINSPPLRDRREDIPGLVEYFLRQPHPRHAGEGGLSDEAIAELRSRPWPGNVRKLRNTIEHATIVARGRTIRREHLPASAAPASAATSLTDEIRKLVAEWARRDASSGRAQTTDSTLHERFLALTEPPVIEADLKLCLQNRAAAAQLLGIHRATLRQKLHKYGMA
jgi:DNA-binding NtrC family response regulator